MIKQVNHSACKLNFTQNNFINKLIIKLDYKNERILSNRIKGLHRFNITVIFKIYPTLLDYKNERILGKRIKGPHMFNSTVIFKIYSMLRSKPHFSLHTCI